MIWDGTETIIVEPSSRGTLHNGSILLCVIHSLVSVVVVVDLRRRCPRDSTSSKRVHLRAIGEEVVPSTESPRVEEGFLTRPENRCTSDVESRKFRPQDSDGFKQG
ncbi:Hypothetical predicted protein [Marmota monax]|uniref:Uncharacterized protein n=1 Tax=Marmota monax TaxID=9995 RepID=A0A5E4AG37_MARMO|nr:Hypothetical predicted protein [Marmota monax]